MTYTQRDLDKLMSKRRGRAIVKCRAVRKIAGGQPAGDKALAAFVKYHLDLDPESNEGKSAIARIKNEEIGERDTGTPEGELDNKEVYQVNVIRRNMNGPFLLEHQIKAMLKQSASRLGYFVKKRGSKGDMAELGTVRAHGTSLQFALRPWEIHLRKNGQSAPTSYDQITGCVSTTQGKKSIMHHTEVADEGSEFAFEFDWIPDKLGKNAMLEIIAAATQIGIGSCQSLGYGKFEVVELDIDMPVKVKKEA